MNPKSSHRVFPILFFTVLLGGLLIRCQSQQSLQQTIDTNFSVAADQYRHMMELLPDDRFPQNYDYNTGEMETSGSGWWCSGFYPGTLFYLYEETGAEDLYNEATRILSHLEKEQHNTSTHDLGFMMYCSFGNAHRINPKPEYREILINSAKSLSTRFNPTVGCIKSWDSDPDDFLVIIDNMMNLELLFWATEATGDSSFYDIAVTHANTTIENHFREDTSSWHVLNYDPDTGEIQEKRTAQGYSDESAWSRGQSWGLYGFTVTYRETGDKKYLRQAEGIANFLLNHPNLPEDKIPYWDYNAPNIPDAKRDASAGAIMASGLLELSQYASPEDSATYFATAETIIRTLSTDEYMANVGTNGGFILKHSVGSKPADSEVDVAITYADYYFVEAMRRYQDLTVE
ncbi:MAG: glycoside hydrolase family 88 protein [Candidatus Marinimicrobia bacterium]|nr:glycoside hydrolase family 88 protein [Candidatus Neomarinimicrobiota bacterium]MCF7880249.1 glycoside hydrolase family 88 protein [Candidatus Neomarinimicrobiota bacterium]